LKHARQAWIAAAGISVAAMAAQALNPPSASDGPIKLLACVVTPAGILEAAVDSSAEEAMTCDFRCHYELAGRMFTHTFTATVPARFQGRVGNFDTHNARPGSYQGEVARCYRTSR
jgi:hypothetical protein